MVRLLSHLHRRCSIGSNEKTFLLLLEKATGLWNREIFGVNVSTGLLSQQEKSAVPLGNSLQGK